MLVATQMEHRDGAAADANVQGEVYGPCLILPAFEHVKLLVQRA